MKLFTQPSSKLTIKSKRLILRPYKFSDYKLTVDALRKRLPKVNEHDQVVSIAKIKKAELFKDKVMQHREALKNKRALVLGIFSANEKNYLGQIDFFVINEQLRWGNLGYWLHNQHWGKGYATEAGELSLQLAFQKCNFHRIEAGTTTDNVHSIRVLEKLNMHKEGIRKNFFPDEVSQEMIFYSSNSIDFEL